MNKNFFLMILILALGAIGTASQAHLTRLTVINKSGRAIEISLTGQNLEQSYYLHIPEGTFQSPVEQVFTLVPDTYSSNLYYVELWDPVYGNQCSSKSQTLNMTRNVSLIVFECDHNPVNGGEPPSIIKYGGRNQRIRMQ